MRKVKFNACTEVHMIPDERYADFCQKMEDMKYNNFKDLGERIFAGSQWEYKRINIDDIAEVPNWYYEVNKDKYIKVGVSFSKYKTPSGEIIPFNTDEAVRHGDMVDGTQTMKKVKLFELVEEDIMTVNSENSLATESKKPKSRPSV